MATVKQSGGDYSTLNAAMAAGQTTIDIQGTWTAADTTAASNTTVNVVVTADTDSKHPGYISGGNYYRLEVSSGHSITTTQNLTITGIVIKQDGTTAGNQGVNTNAANINLQIRECIIYGRSTQVDQQAGVFIRNRGGMVLTMRQCTVFNFGRSGVRFDPDGADDHTAHLNSNVFFNNAGHTANALGGIVITSTSGATTVINAHNNMALKNNTQAGADWKDSAIGIRTWNVSHSIDGDNSIAGLITSGTGNLASRTTTDSSSPGAGDWVIFNDITTYPFDLRLKDHASENDAKNMHATATAHGITIPATDVVNTSRPQATNYDCGPFEIVSGAPPARRRINIAKVEFGTQAGGLRYQSEAARPTLLRGFAAPYFKNIRLLLNEVHR